jgi:lipopolysaccharide exporter
MSDGLARQAGSALFWKGVQLASTKGIFLVRTVILARMLAPDDFGLLAIATAALGFLLSITNLGMVPALVQRAESDARHFDTAWTIGVIRAVLISAVVAAGAPLLAAAFNEPRATELIRVLAVMPLLDAAASIGIARLTRELRFRPLVLTRLAEALANTAVAISLARFLGVWALVAGQLAGAITYLLASYIAAPHRPRLALDRDAAQSLVRFGRWVFVIGLIAVSGGLLLQLTIARSVGAAGLGLYVLASKLAFLPVELASEVVGAVGFPVYARLQSNLDQARRAFQSSIIGMSLLLIPACALLIALAPRLVAELLGSRWEGTAPLIQILAVASIVSLFGEAVVPILNGLGQPQKVAAVELVQSGLLVIFIWLLARRYGSLGVALAWLPALVIAQLISARFLRRLLDRPLRGLAPPLGAITAATALGAAVAVSAERAVTGMLGLFAAGALGLGSIALVLWCLERYFQLGLSASLPGISPRVAKLVGLAPPEA